MKALVIIMAGDGSDGAEFINEGTLFVEHHDVPDSDVLVYNTKTPNDIVRAKFEADCQARAGNNYDLVAFFGHGGNIGSQYPGGWINLHYNSNPNGDGYVQYMAEALDLCISDGAVIVLYACLVGAGPDSSKTKWANQDPEWVTEGSFAKLLQDRLSRKWGKSTTVLAHTTAGHTTKNPMVVAIDDFGTTWVVEPGSSDVARWNYTWDNWSYQLKAEGVESGNTLRFDYPLYHIGSADIPNEVISPTTAIPIVAGVILLAFGAYHLFRT